MKNIALFGNPIKHSKSYLIYDLFSKQLNISLSYKNILCNGFDDFKDKINIFFKENNGYGANITLPFKEVAVNICNKLSHKSVISNSINVIKINKKKLIGYNTDGLGIISDLKRLKFINKKFNLLIIGAGGSVKSIIPDLYNKVNNIFIINRTLKKAYKIEDYFYKKNIKNIYIFDINNIYKKKIDLIINATSSGISGNVPNIPNKLINKNTICYDLFYNINNDTPFISWCKYNGSIFNSDGIGMLVSQAAYSFKIWFGILPNISKIIYDIKNSINFY